ncbi:hypothetical protein ACIREE_22015 [Streptomyces sp. NPDC102467]|uniref:hypothetical protein n=1 Tax=Streptomyces sp. NPDC102467 TaxID=3366179 RepID=UPI0037FB97C8
MSSTLLAIAFILLITLCYAGMCATVPFRDCPRCNGMGHDIKTDRKGRQKRGHDCRHCKATGKRIRLGRHLYNLWARTYRDGTR